jgi:hypothetical protein
VQTIRGCSGREGIIHYHLDRRRSAENVVTIDRPYAVALIGEAAKKLTRGNKTEAVALAVRRLAENAREGSLFGAHQGSVRVREGTDIIGPILHVEPDAAMDRGDLLKLEALRAQVKDGVDALDRDEYLEFDDARLDAYLAGLNGRY